ncbi:MAG: septation regulator SpoVG [Deltaproteobacteria bacterium]|nr:septation regulator SpoVG [Deltaproteobacteria bacterium]
MNITDVKVLTVSDDEKLKAFVSIVIDNCFVVRDIKVISGNTGLFVAMPAKKMKDGSHRDVAHPIDKTTRQMLVDHILVEYNKAWSSKKKTEDSVEDKSHNNTVRPSTFASA